MMLRNRQRELNNRQIMLQSVHDFWVKGVLERSLPNARLIELTVEEKPEAAEYPGEAIRQSPDQSDLAHPSGTKIIDIFDESGGLLLILGEAGSGKTTMLLELTRDLLDRAERDSKCPIPVVFNLSSWSNSKKNFVEWIVSELGIMYQIPNKIGRRWVAEEQILLFLDGLDEIRNGRRARCVVAVNAFLKDHTRTGVVVCSRKDEYEKLETEWKVKLKKARTIQLRPLSPQQIYNFLRTIGFQSTIICQTFMDDTVLPKLLQSPLMLNMMVRAYQGKAIDGLLGFDTTVEGRHSLIDEYVKQMLRRRDRTKDRLYSNHQTIIWLSWLAQKMRGRHESVFSIEWMQSSWLSTYFHQGIFAFGFRVPIISAVALLSWLFIWPFFVLQFEHVLGFYRIIFGGAIPVSLWMFFYYLGDDIIPVEATKWSWKTAMNDLRLKFSLGFGLILTPLCNFAYPASFVLFVWTTWLCFFTAGGFSYEAVRLKSVSSYPMAQATKNCVRIWLLFLGVYGGLFGLLFAFLGVTITSWSAAIATWLIIGLIGGLKYGGLAVFQHYILRLLFYVENHIPLNYGHFLNYCVDRTLLHKVGGEYIFVDRLLSEYFASLTPEDIEQLANKTSVQN